MSKYEETKNIYVNDGFISLVKRGSSFAFRNLRNKTLSTELLDDLAYRKSLAELEEYKRSEEELEDILDTVYKYGGVGRYQKLEPIQHRSEFRAAVERVSKESPNSMLEVGTAYGGSLYVFSRGIESLISITSLDIGHKKHYRDRIQLYRTFSDVELNFVMGDSNDPNTQYLTRPPQLAVSEA